MNIECQTSKYVVGGSIDIGIGTESNGSKPYIHIQNSSEKLSIYLGSLGEVKSSTVRLARDPRVGSDFNVSEEDTKAVIQPMLELMAIAEVAKFPNENVPIVSIFGGKMVFRPFFN